MCVQTYNGPLEWRLEKLVRLARYPRWRVSRALVKKAGLQPDAGAEALAFGVENGVLETRTVDGVQYHRRVHAT